MRTITLKQLRLNLTKELKNLPFKITFRGKTIAEVITSGSKSTKKHSEVITSPSESSSQRVFKICKVKFCDKHPHSMLIGCKCPVCGKTFN